MHVFGCSVFMHLQLEVLETLVHNGADLNAKNKHDETPAGTFIYLCNEPARKVLLRSKQILNDRYRFIDICEDLEMRARIAQLVTEREARARVSNGSGGPGNRRGTGGARPSSSRAQSVRRTSLRERGLTAKHDAHEEARMRHTFVGVAPNAVRITSELFTYKNLFYIFQNFSSFI